MQETEDINLSKMILEKFAGNLKMGNLLNKQQIIMEFIKQQLTEFKMEQFGLM